jgi:hypothetical protein
VDVGTSTAGDRGREVGDELTGGVGKTEREWARGKGTTPTDRPHKATRGREGVSAQAGADRRGPPVRHREHAGARGGLGWLGLNGPKWLFSISREFLIAFLLIFSRVFNSNSNQVSNSNQIKHVQQFKEYLGSI